MVTCVYVDFSLKEDTAENGGMLSGGGSDVLLFTLLYFLLECGAHTVPPWPVLLCIQNTPVNRTKMHGPCKCCK